jgi:hypothetical protein
MANTSVLHDDVEEDESPGSAPTTRPQSNHIARSYTAVAHKSANIKDLENFMKSKIQPGHEGVINPLTLSGKTLGWANLVLDDAATEDIAKHEGVLGMRESLQVCNN